MKETKNWVKIEIAARSENEGFARSAVAAFASALNPTVEEVDDLRTAVSEAVTNCVVHAYGRNVSLRGGAKIIIECEVVNREIIVSVTDFGVGIDNVERAMEPFYTSAPDDERSGMGFTVMQSFMDTLAVKSSGKGTTVTMTKRFAEVKKTATMRGKVYNVITKEKEKKACGG